MTPARQRFPWTPEEERYVRQAYQARTGHKLIARRLNRTPRAVDQQIARMKERGLLKMHEAEEAQLLSRLEREAATPEFHRDERT